MINELEFLSKYQMKCTVCGKSGTLIKLPDEIQEYSKEQGYTSYFCTNGCHLVNFIRYDQ